MKKIFTLCILFASLFTKAQDNCLNFKSGDYIDLGSALPQLMSGDSASTVEFWFKGTNLGYLNFSGISFIIGGNGDLVQTMASHTLFTLRAKNIVQDDAWHHLAFTYEKGKLFAIYIDGIPYFKSIPQNVSLPVFPASSVATINNFVGNLDEFRVWDKALTQSEIQANMYCSIPSTQSNLLLNLKFNQGIAGGNNNTVTIVADSSGNNNTGILFGFTFSGTVSNWVSTANQHANVGALGLKSWVSVSEKPARSKSANLTVSSHDYNNNNDLFFAFKDDSSGNKCSVVQKIGDSLVYVGAPGFSAGIAADVILKVDSSQNLVALCLEAARIKAYKYVSGSWTALGTVGSTYTNNSFKYFDLAFGSNDSIFVVYADSAFAYKTAVKKYDGASWINVGNAILSVGASQYCQIEMDSNKQSYIMFTDNVSGTNTIKTLAFGNGLWAPLGNSSIVNNARFIFKINPITQKLQIAVQNSYTIEVKEYTTAFVNLSTLVTSTSSSLNIADFLYDVNGIPLIYENNSHSGYTAKATTLALVGTSNPFQNVGYPTYLMTDNFGSIFAPIHSLNFNNNSLSAKYKGTYIFQYTPSADRVNVANTSVCGLGNSKTLSITNPILLNNTNWVWYTSLCPQVVAGAGSSITVSPVITTKYFVRSEGGTIASPFDTVMVKIDTIPNITIVSTADSVCKGKIVNILASGSNSYVWTPLISNGNNFVANASNIYTVVATNATTGCSTTGTKSLSVIPLPAVQASVTDSNFCKGNIVTFSAIGLPSNTYAWINASVVNNVPVNTSLFNTGNYVVKATDAFGCTATSNVLVIINPAFNIYLGNDTNVCKGDAFYLSAGNQTSYLWNDGSTSLAHYADSSGTFILTCTNTVGCVASDTVIVTQQLKPVVTYVINDSVFCATAGSINISGGLPLGGVYSGTAVFGTAFNATNAGIGTFNITYTYQDGNKCSNKAIKKVKVVSCVGINDNALNKLLFNAYPNPANNTINIDATENGTIQLINSMGQMVANYTIKIGSNNINTSLIASGIYTMMFNTEAHSKGAVSIQIAH